MLIIINQPIITRVSEISLDGCDARARPQATGKVAEAGLDINQA
jgi:hypothetical protein